MYRDSVPNTCFFGPRLVKIGFVLTVCTWNDGCSLLHGLVQRLELQPTLSSLHVLQAQDLEGLSRSVYKESSSAKLLKKACEGNVKAMKITMRHKKVVKCMLREKLVSMDRM